MTNTPSQELKRQTEESARPEELNTRQWGGARPEELNARQWGGVGSQVALALTQPPHTLR